MNPARPFAKFLQPRIKQVKMKCKKRESAPRWWWVSSFRPSIDHIVLNRLQRQKFEDNPALAQEFIEHLAVVGSGFCYETKLVPSKEDGYVQLSWVGANKFCTLGEMLGWAAGKRCMKPEDQISHRCHNPKCAIPSHVVVESATANNNRKGCRVWVDCPHGCEEKILVCEHTPSCIRYVPGYESWEAFRTSGVHGITKD
jgi:homing endonuclease-like protein